MPLTSMPLTTTFSALCQVWEALHTQIKRKFNIRRIACQIKRKFNLFFKKSYKDILCSLFVKSKLSSLFFASRFL
jgi:hypothetical protein